MRKACARSIHHSSPSRCRFAPPAGSGRGNDGCDENSISLARNLVNAVGLWVAIALALRLGLRLGLGLRGRVGIRTEIKTGQA